MWFSDNEAETNVDVIRSKFKGRKSAKKYLHSIFLAYGEVCLKCGLQNCYSGIYSKHAKKDMARFNKKLAAKLKLIGDDVFHVWM